MKWPLTVLSFCAAITCIAQQPFDLDTTFRTLIHQQYVNSVLPLVDGDLVISGNMRFPGDIYDRTGARLNADGSRDLAFAEVPFMGGRLVPWNGRIYARNGNGVRRSWPDGTLDNDFIALNSGPYFNTAQGGDMHVYPDGRIILTGFHSLSDTVRGFEGTYNVIWFSNQGYLDTTQTHRQCDGSIDFIHELPDGKFLLSGVYTTYEGQPAGRIIRVQPDGALDTSFDTSIYWGQAYGCRVQSDGKILAVGRFRVTGDPDTLHLLRLLPDGALDPSFNNHLRAVYFDDGGLIPWTDLYPLPGIGWIVHGGFSSIDEQIRGGIALVDTAGQLLDTYFSGPGCGAYEYMGSPYASVETIVPDPLGSGYYICGAYHGYDDGTIHDTLQRFVSKLYGLDVGMAEPKKSPESTVKVYPNPASTWVVLEYALDTSEQGGTLVIQDLMGRVVYSSVLRGATGQLLWDTRQIPAGTYTVLLQGATKGPITEKLIVRP